MKPSSEKRPLVELIILSPTRSLATLRTSRLCALLGGIGFLILALGYWATNTFLGDEYPILWGNIPIVVSFFVWGWIGVVIFARREMPWAITLRGYLAAFAGLIIAGMFWGLAIMFLLPLI